MQSEGFCGLLPLWGGEVGRGLRPVEVEEWKLKRRGRGGGSERQRCSIVLPRVGVTKARLPWDFHDHEDEPQRGCSG
jgi:hypothetical protein